MIASVTLVRRVLPAAVVLLLVVGLLSSFAELSPMDAFYAAFLPPIGREADIHPSYASSIDVPGSHVAKGEGHPIRAGLLHVDLNLPADEHPIYQLIRDSKKSWVKKNARQSRTLRDAVVEYRRRNSGRNPPKGFDKWWAWRECVLR